MTDRCDAAGRRPRDHSATESSCEPRHEETAASQVAKQQAAEHEAEARRDAYFAAGTDEGGRSMAASSDVGAVQTFTPDDELARLVAHTKACDPPIQSDPLGNALIGVLAGGFMGGVQAAAGRVGLEAAGGAFLLPLSKDLVKQRVVGEATGGAAFAMGAASSAARSAVKQARNAALLAAPAELADALELGKQRAADGGARGDASPPPAAEPNRSEGPRIPEAAESSQTSQTSQSSQSPNAVPFSPLRIQG